MISEIQEYKQSKDKEYKFNRYIFVSSNGFIDNALKLANSNNIECYTKNSENQFIKVTEWN